MQAIVGAILILAGSVLLGAGIISDGVNKGEGGHGTVGYILGSLVALVGLAALLSGVLKRAWDAIPADSKKPG